MKIFIYSLPLIILILILLIPTKKKDTMDNKEDKLALLYQNFNINKMYKNYILIGLFILLTSAYFINFYVIQKEETQYIKNMSDILINKESHKDFEDMKKNISEQVKMLEPLNNISISFTNSTALSLLLMDIMDNSLNLFVDLSDIKEADFNKEEIILRLEKNVQNLETYSIIKFNKKSNSSMVKVSNELLEINLKIKNINEYLIKVLKEDNLNSNQLEKLIFEKLDNEIENINIESTFKQAYSMNKRIMFSEFVLLIFLVIVIVYTIGIGRFYYLRKKYFNEKQKAL